MTHTPTKIPEDLYPLYVACGTGAASHRAGFRVTTNAYAPDRMPWVALPREERMKAWAWDLGWREAACLAHAAIGEGMATAERLRERL